MVPPPPVPYVVEPMIVPPFAATRSTAAAIAETAQVGEQPAVGENLRQLPGTLENTSHGARRVRPPNKRGTFRAAVKEPRVQSVRYG